MQEYAILDLPPLCVHLDAAHGHGGEFIFLRTGRIRVPTLKDIPLRRRRHIVLGRLGDRRLIVDLGTFAPRICFGPVVEMNVPARYILAVKIGDLIGETVVVIIQIGTIARNAVLLRDRSLPRRGRCSVVQGFVVGSAYCLESLKLGRVLGSRDRIAGSGRHILSQIISLTIKFFCGQSGQVLAIIGFKIQMIGPVVVCIEPDDQEVAVGIVRRTDDAVIQRCDYALDRAVTAG